MNNQKTIFQKSEQFRNEIRRKYIQEHFAKQRALHLERMKLSQHPEKIEKKIHCCFTQKIFKHYFEKHNLSVDLLNLERVPIFQGFIVLENLNQNFPSEIMQMTLDRIDDKDAMYLLSFLIIHYSSTNRADVFLNLGAVEILFDKVHQYISLKGGLPYARLLMNCIKNLAFMRIQRARDLSVVGKYLPLLMKEMLDEPSTLVLVSFITEQEKVDEGYLSKLCTLAYSKDRLVKLSIATILINYIILASGQELLKNFVSLCQALQHLSLHAKQFSSSDGDQCFKYLGVLFEKVPTPQLAQIASIIQECKVENFIILHMQISQMSKKLMALNIVEVLVDKCIEQSVLFSYLNPELLFYVVEGLDYSEVNIITKCLKIILKMCAGGFSEEFLKVDRAENLKYTFQNLLHHENQFIKGMAENLLNLYFNQNV